MSPVLVPDWRCVISWFTETFCFSLVLLSSPCLFIFPANLSLLQPLMLSSFLSLLSGNRSRTCGCWTPHLRHAAFHSAGHTEPAGHFLSLSFSPARCFLSLRLSFSLAFFPCLSLSLYFPLCLSRSAVISALAVDPHRRSGPARHDSIPPARVREREKPHWPENTANYFPGIRWYPSWCVCVCSFQRLCMILTPCYFKPDKPIQLFLLLFCVYNHFKC